MTTTPHDAPRRRLFQKAQAPDRELRPRELAIVHHIARHRLINSRDLAALDGGSPQQVLRILRELYDLGYITRPTMQVHGWKLAGAQPLVYGLTNKGGRLLHGRRALNSDHSENNRRANSTFIAHTAETAGFMARLEAAVRRHDGVTMRDQAAVLAEAPEATRRLREPLRIKGRENAGAPRQPVSVIPDGLFALDFEDETSAHFFVEWDRGTMPVVRKGLNRTSVGRKFAIYLDAWKAGVFEKQFGERHVRVLTITTTPARVATMKAAVRKLTNGNGSGLFLFIDRATLAAADPLVAEWTSGKSERARLVDGK